MNKNMRILLFLTILSMLLFPALALAEYQVSQYYPLGITPVEKMKPNGEYDIQVLSEGTWQKAGKLTYDKFFRERELDLSSYISGNGEVKIKLIQTGGGAAHIDSIFLGGMPPVEVEGIDNGLKKITKIDFDVVDVSGKEIVVTFPKKTKDKNLILAARVESTVISKIPFQFPSENNHTEMSLASMFYTYNMNTSNESTQPFFKEYSTACSGHPSGYTYGWVRNDDKNLYVRIDFTPDNTMDGDKDYAKVYAKTMDGMKEFKVTMNEKIWGNPAFTYTYEVPYQHKVYEFQIPLSELGINGADESGELLLAFSAYGTAANCPVATTLAYCNGYEATHIVPDTFPGSSCQGTSGDDVIVGIKSGIRIYGRPGDDIICTGAGNNYIQGEGGDDWISGGSGDDTLYGGYDATSTSSGKDKLFGDSGDDNLYGGDDDDKLIGGDGNDYLDGYSGNDKIHGNDGNDDLRGGSGNDILHGNDGNDEIEGGSGNDRLYGGDGDDDLDGESGNDRLYGGDGDDDLVGGTGTDRCFPGWNDSGFVDCEKVIPD